MCALSESCRQRPVVVAMAIAKRFGLSATFLGLGDAFLGLDAKGLGDFAGLPGGHADADPFAKDLAN